MLDNPKPLVWSFTLLKTYRDVCPHQTYRKYILRDIPFETTDAIDWGNKVHAAMEARIGRGKSLPMGMEHWEPFCSPFDKLTIEVELKLGVTREGQPCDYWAGNVWGRGKLDLVVVDGATAYIADHKTGKEREDPFELEVQAVLLKARHPGLTNIHGQYYWLRECKVGRMHNLSNTAETWRIINQTMDRIMASQNSGEWIKRTGPLCAYCDCRDCEYNRKS